jgi:hypothetical protein
VTPVVKARETYFALKIIIVEVWFCIGSADLLHSAPKTGGEESGETTESQRQRKGSCSKGKQFCLFPLIGIFGGGIPFLFDVCVLKQKAN